MQAMSLHFLALLLSTLLNINQVTSVPAGSTTALSLLPHVNHLVRRGGSQRHNPARADEAKRHHTLPWDQLKCDCKVSEQHIPILGNMGWHFEMEIYGFGDGGPKECGNGILDNLHGECHTAIDIRQWGCAADGEWGRRISWDSSKFFNHDGIESAIWKASYEQMGGCKCDFNYGGSLAGSIVSGIAMAVPVPGAQVAKIGATVAEAGIKAALSTAGKDLAKTAIKKGAEHVVKDTVKTNLGSNTNDPNSNRLQDKHVINKKPANKGPTKQAKPLAVPKSSNKTPLRWGGKNPAPSTSKGKQGKPPIRKTSKRPKETKGRTNQKKPIGKKQTSSNKAGKNEHKQTPVNKKPPARAKQSGELKNTKPTERKNKVSAQSDQKKDPKQPSVKKQTKAPTSSRAGKEQKRPAPSRNDRNRQSDQKRKSESRPDIKSEAIKILKKLEADLKTARNELDAAKKTGNKTKISKAQAHFNDIENKYKKAGK